MRLSSWKLWEVSENLCYHCSHFNGPVGIPTDVVIVNSCVSWLVSSWLE